MFQGRGSETWPLISWCKASAVRNSSVSFPCREDVLISMLSRKDWESDTIDTLAKACCKPDHSNEWRPRCFSMAMRSLHFVSSSSKTFRSSRVSDPAWRSFVSQALARCFSTAVSSSISALFSSRSLVSEMWEIACSRRSWHSALISSRLNAERCLTAACHLLTQLSSRVQSHITHWLLCLVARLWAATDACSAFLRHWATALYVYPTTGFQ